MKKAVVLAGALAVSLLGFCAETAPFGSVVGWWRFNDTTAPGKDSSEYGNDLDGLSNVQVKTADTGYTTRGCYDDSGCLHIATEGNTATATPKAIWDESGEFTYLVRVRGDISVSKFLVTDTNFLKLLDILNDKDSWHLVSMRHDPNKKVGSKTYNYSLFGDDPTLGKDTRAEQSIDSGVYFPLSTDIKIGGTVGASTRTVKYKGYMDDICVVQRTMTKNEIYNYYQYGDPNPYLTAKSSTAFASQSNWSCDSGETTGYSPLNMPGADFQVDNGLTLTVASDGVFGGHSLMLGRLADLVSVVDSTKKRTKNGNLTAQANLTFNDLRLFSGKLTASAGKTLSATALKIYATKAAPYEVNVASGTYTITGAASGGGYLKKTGAGKLDLSGISGAANVLMTEGSVKTAVLNGYTDGTVLVNTERLVDFVADDTVSEVVKLQFETAPTMAGTYPVMTVPTAKNFTAASFDDKTTYAGGLKGTPVVGADDNGKQTVSIRVAYPDPLTVTTTGAVALSAQTAADLPSTVQFASEPAAGTYTVATFPATFDASFADGTSYPSGRTHTILVVENGSVKEVRITVSPYPTDKTFEVSTSGAVTIPFANELTTPVTFSFASAPTAVGTYTIFNLPKTSKTFTVADFNDTTNYGGLEHTLSITTDANGNQIVKVTVEKTEAVITWTTAFVWPVQ